MNQYIYLVCRQSKDKWNDYEEVIEKAYTIKRLAYQYRDMKNKSNYGYNRYIKKKKISEE